MRTQDAVPTESCGGGGVLWTIKIAFLFMRAVTQKPTKQKKKTESSPTNNAVDKRSTVEVQVTHTDTHTHKIKLYKKTPVQLLI